MTINNLSENLKAYVVVRQDEYGELWYWGTWEEYGKAADVAARIGGEVVSRDNVVAG